MRGQRWTVSVVVVTGASSGLGVYAGARSPRRGRKPVLAARRADRLEALARRSRGADGVACDVTGRSGSGTG